MTEAFPAKARELEDDIIEGAKLTHVAAAADEKWRNNKIVRGSGAYDAVARAEHDELAPIITGYQMHLRDWREKKPTLERELKHVVFSHQQEVFNKMIDSDASIEWGRTKLVILGQGRAGKTATVRSIMGQPFKEEWDSTVGLDLTEAKLPSTQGRPWRRANRDKFEEELAMKAVPEYRGRVALADTSGSTKGDDDINKHYHKMREAKLNANGISISIWDYGGQKVFHTMHHLFLTEYGVYLIVFNLVDIMADDDEETREHVDFWLKSLKLHAPQAPFILVGTHYDEVNDPTDCVQIVEQKLQNMNVNLKEGLVKDGHRMFFRINNRNPNSVDNLRECIKTTALNQEYVHEKVSCKWMKCLDYLVSHGPHVTWDDFKQCAIDNGFEPTDQELTDMLNKWHEYGLILYFDSSTLLREKIISNPQWVVDQFSKIIFDPSVHEAYREKLDTSRLVKDADTLCQKGLASRDLLDCLWDNQETGYLVELMQRLLLINRFKYKSILPFRKGEEMYLVPSMVRTGKLGNLPLSKVGRKKERKECTIVIAFDFLPAGIFERIICKVIESSGQESKHPPLMSVNQARLWLDRKVYVTFIVKEAEDLIEARTPTKHHDQVFFQLKRIFQSLNSEWLKGRLQWNIKKSDNHPGIHRHSMDESAEETITQVKV